MLCYRDRTFCPFYHSCTNGKECDSALTPEVKAEAALCDLPYSAYVKEPSCHIKRETSAETN